MPIRLSFQEIIEGKLKGLKESHLFRTLEEPKGLSFHHNDYLGLSSHPAILAAMESWVSVVGAGGKGSRLLGGHSRLFDETESQVADFFGAPAALLFSSGYLANLSIMQVLGECVEHIVSDEKNHASLIDGIRLTQKPKTILPHSQWEKLTISKNALLVTEGCFSMDGDLLDVPQFLEVAKASEAFIHIDEAHSAGIFFEEGQGIAHPSTFPWESGSKTVTFGKAFGQTGAAILCSKSLRDLLINRGRGFIYTTAPSPIVLVGIQKALEVSRAEVWRREELWSRAEKVREILGSLLENPKNLWEKRVPILIVPIRGEERALSLARNMREFGFEIRAIRYPTVPKGEERLRITLNLQVSRENTETMAELLRSVLEKERVV